MLRSIPAIVLLSLSSVCAVAEMPKLEVGPKAKFQTVQAAIDAAPKTGAMILLAPGTYREKIHITTPNIHLVGSGKTPNAVVLSWDDAAKNAGGTGRSGSVTVDADGLRPRTFPLRTHGRTSTNAPRRARRRWR